MLCQVVSESTGTRGTARSDKEPLQDALHQLRGLVEVRREWDGIRIELGAGESDNPLPALPFGVNFGRCRTRAAIRTWLSCHAVSAAAAFDLSERETELERNRSHPCAIDDSVFMWPHLVRLP
jgi:hypothetical protein